MLFERFEAAGLSHYSYALGCPGDGRVVIVDPQRDIDVYLRFAEGRQLQISHVLETHIHADFASGARELAQVTGAEHWVSGYDHPDTFKVQFPHHNLEEGDSIEVGTVKIEALHTPGHTPEHLSYLVYDLSRSATDPSLMLSGDFLFVGSVGRPDLLGDDAKQDLARQLFSSTRKKLRDLPDGLEIHPAHGAGSLCGSGMSGRPSSTLGYERRHNPYLDPDLTESAFVEKVLASVPPFPAYYRRMKWVNSDGPPFLEDLPGEALSIDRFAELVDAGATVVDLRDSLAFAGGHIPGSLGIGTGPTVGVWASWAVPYERPIVLVSDHDADVTAAVRQLIQVGHDMIHGHLEGGIRRWVLTGRPLARMPSWSVEELQGALERDDDAPQVIDVRTESEWRQGHVPGAQRVFAGEALANAEAVPATGPVAIVCQSGYRSTVVSSALERAGRSDFVNVTGGMAAWNARQFPTSTENES